MSTTQADRGLAVEIVRFRQTGYDSATRRDQNAEGWLGCFAKLEGALG